MMKDPTQEFNRSDDEGLEHFSLPYRRGVGLMVFNQNRDIFIGKRIDTKTDTWQMPQGGIKEDETVAEAGLRELYEETNMVDVKIIAETQNWLYYDLPTFLIDRLWDGQYRGQKQKWLLVRFFGPDSVIDIKKSSAEFKKWKWIGLDKVPEIVTPFKKHLYTSVVEEFRDVIKASV